MSIRIPFISTKFTLPNIRTMQTLPNQKKKTKNRIEKEKKRRHTLRVFVRVVQYYKHFARTNRWMVEKVKLNFRLCVCVSFSLLTCVFHRKFFFLLLLFSSNSNFVCFCVFRGSGFATFFVIPLFSFSIITININVLFISFPFGRHCFNLVSGGVYRYICFKCFKHILYFFFFRFFFPCYWCLCLIYHTKSIDTHNNPRFLCFFLCFVAYSFAFFFFSHLIAHTRIRCRRLPFV